MQNIFNLFQPFLEDLGEKLLQFSYDNQKIQGKELAKKADWEASQRIWSFLEENFPNDNIMGEEQGLKWKNGEFTWVVDPIDGTSNYSHRFPLWAISICRCQGQSPISGLVYLPALKSFYWAEKGKGSFHNQNPIHALKNTSYQKGFLVGHSGSRKEEKTIAVGKLRRTGSVAADLAFLAHGIFLAVYAPEPHLWDMAAGYLLVKEAGGVTKRLDEKALEPFDFQNRESFPLLGKANSKLPDPLWYDE